MKAFRIVLVLSLIVASCSLVWAEVESPKSSNEAVSLKMPAEPELKYIKEELIPLSTLETKPSEQKASDTEEIKSSIDTEFQAKSAE